MKIAIYGGSFDPVHLGHTQIARYVIDKLKIDKLFFVPANQSPFKKHQKYAPNEHRYKMLDLVKVEKSEISTFELKRKGVSYTIDTINYFASKYPQAKIYLIIGFDNLPKLNKWKDIEKIALKTNIVALKRPGYSSHPNIKKFNVKVLQKTSFNHTSSNFRKGDFSLLDSKVNQYIGKNQLYINQLMLGMLDPVRHKHSISVASYATRYAKSLKYDARRAWIAGALHDITKSWPKEKHRRFLANFGIEDNLIKDFELHALTGYLWVKYVYKLQDQEVAEAILRHTSLAYELSILDKIIYAADKLCLGRKHPGIQRDRQLMLEDFDQGFKNLIRVIYQFLIKKRDLSKFQEEVYQKWMK